MFLNLMFLQGKKQFFFLFLLGSSSSENLPEEKSQLFPAQTSFSYNHLTCKGILSKLSQTSKLLLTLYSPCETTAC